MVGGGVGDSAVCSGVVMLASKGEADGFTRAQYLRQIISLLQEALRLLDELKNHAETGARLATIIEDLQDQRDE